MDVIQLKSDIHSLIDKVNDTSVLKAIRTILRKQTEEVDWYDQLSDAERKSIKRGISDANSGKLIPHEEVMKKVRAKYNLD